MKNLWPSGFKQIQSNSPKSILDEQSKLLPSLTGDMVGARVVVLGDIESAMIGHDNDFRYSYQLIGKFLKNYKFKVFSFSHSVTMYPVFVRIDGEIAKELGVSESIKVETEKDFVELVEKIYKSERIGLIIGSIIQISRSS